MTFRDTVFYRYHDATKHTVARLYANPHFLDWATQPDPFRRYDGATTLALPRPTRPAPHSFFDAARATAPAALDLQAVANLLYYSMAISAWKEIPDRGVRWSLRANPSSGNLHPTETHLAVRGVSGLADGIYHFRVDTFHLETRLHASVDPLAAELQAHCGLPQRGITILLTSIFWREAWKYRERAFRYCHHDLGHALAAITEAAHGLGWPATYRHLFDDETVVRLFGLHGSDEYPGVLLAVGPDIAGGLRAAGGAAVRFAGRPNALSPETITYPAIEGVYAATCGLSADSVPTASRVRIESDQRVSLARDAAAVDDFWSVVRKRRSAVEMDGETGITAEQLGTLLFRATRGAEGDIFDALGTEHSRRGGQAPHGTSLPRFFIHLYLYLHRVTSVAPGVYYYDRMEHALVPLLLRDQRREAAYLSLQQSIAGNGAFAVSLVADFRAAFASFGERGYRAVHIEAGFIGQGLYLGAESVGTNSTGIGAFFDDDVNRYLALPEGLEVIYHFTVGRAVHDPRLRTASAYDFPDPTRFTQTEQLE